MVGCQPIVRAAAAAAVTSILVAQGFINCHQQSPQAQLLGVYVPHASETGRHPCSQHSGEFVAELQLAAWPPAIVQPLTHVLLCPSLHPCPQQPPAAKLVLANWPGSKACNDKTWINDCTSQMTAQVNGTNVVFTPSVSNAFNEKCDPASGIVIGPKGTQAAVSFPQYPIGLTSTGPDGTLQIDFSTTAADDPNNMDWSQCVVSYKIIQGQFLNPMTGFGAAGGMSPYAAAQGAAGARANAAGSSSSSSSAWLLAAQLLAAAAVAAWVML